MTEINCKTSKVKVLSKYVMELCDIDGTKYTPYKTGGVLKEVKKQRKMKFLPLAKAYKSPGEFQMMDFMKFDRYFQLHCAFQALSRWNSQDSLQTAEGVDKFVRLTKEIAGKEREAEINEEYLSKFAQLSHANLNPICAFVGGIAAQEVLKYTGKFTPIKQFFYFDALEVVPDPLPQDRQPKGSRYDGQVAAFGAEQQKKIEETSYFLVGCGALGCEFLKNFAMMGMGQNAEGSVTDMDTIEKSNLNRQFLFRDGDLGEMKSLTAARKVKEMNPRFKVTAYDVPVGRDTESLFDRRFWSSLDVVVNALDTWKARLYTDSKCIEFGKPLLESGTLGASGHTQVILPHVTQHFGAVKVRAAKEIPLCTLHNFPHSIEHTIHWAKDKWEGMFIVTPQNANKHMEDSDHIRTLLSSLPLGAKVELLEKVDEALQGLETFDQCVEKSRLLFETHFVNNIVELLSNYPEDHIDEATGAPFWSPPRRAPVALKFDLGDDLHRMFIESTSCMFAFMQKVDVPEDFDYQASLDKVKIPTFVPSQIVIADDGVKAEDSSADMKKLEVLEKRLGVGGVNNNNNNNNYSGAALAVSSFEKDNDANHHIDCIHSWSNLRALNYLITPVERLETKKIAGKIVPAMVTTTAMITGLVGLQLYNIIQGKKDVESFMEGNVDLSSNLLALVEPERVKGFKSRGDVVAIPENFTVWDSINIRIGNASVIKLGKYLATTYNVKLLGMSCEGAYLFRASDKKHREERAKKAITKLYMEAKKLEKMPKHVRKLELTLLCKTRDTNKDVEFATINFFFRKQKGAMANKPKRTKVEKE